MDEQLGKPTTFGFGAALAIMKGGGSVQRTGWHGSGLKLWAQIPDENSKMSLPYIYMEYPENHEIYPGAKVPWLCSVSDFVSSDYAVVDEPHIIIEDDPIANVIAVLVNGGTASRLGWNGKNMHLFFVPGKNGTLPHIMLKLPNGSIVPWVPSQTDIFGPDWVAGFSEPAGNREFTYGERMVGLNFNPSKSGEVFDCKTAFAAEIDRMNKLREEARDPEQKRLASIAITELQTAQMWAVKALTWG